MDDDLYVITGPNGGGKSTLFRVLSGVRKARNMKIKGEAKAFGFDPLREVPNVGIVFQEHYRHHLGSTPYGEVFMHLIRSGLRYKEAKQKALKILEERSLKELAFKPMERLSDGEKLRAILAATFSTDPPAYILDEPLSSLDPMRASRIVRIIRGLSKPVLVFEHRREFFGKAHVAIVDGQLKKARPRKDVIIRSRREGSSVELKLFGRKQRIPMASRGIIPIRGPNGGGKTTLLRSLFKALKGKAIYVPSDPSLSLHGPRAEDEADRIYKGPIWNLSFGQRKELSVVAGLLRKAEVYLLDEPFKGLDDDARKRVLELIERKSEEAAVYLATNERESIKVSGPELWVEGGEVIEKSSSDGPSFTGVQRS